MGWLSFVYDHEVQFITCGVRLAGLELTALILDLKFLINEHSQYFVKFHEEVRLDQRL